MRAIKDNATYVEKIVTQDDGDSDFVKVTDTTVNYIPNEIPLLDTTTNTQLESKEELVENDEVLLIDTDNNITETKLGSVTTGTTDATQTLDIFNDNSCIATYTFDDENANDLSGNYNGNWYGTEQYDTGKFGKAAKFNGNSYIDTGFINTSLTKFSLSCWIKCDNYSNLGNYSGLLMNKGNSGDKRYGFRIKHKNDNPCIWNGADNLFDEINMSEYNGVFVNLALVFDSEISYAKLYINSELKQEITINEGLKFDTAIIGYNNQDNTGFNGLIDQVRIFNRALTDDEVKQLYNEQAKKYIADISSANLSEAPTKAFKKQLPSVSIAIEATKTDITDASFNELTPETTTYDGSKFTTVYSDLAKKGRVIQRKIVAPNKGIQVIEPFTSNLWKKG